MTFVETEQQRKRNILVVDDDEIVLATLHGILERRGYNVATASDGQAGVDAILNQKFDLVICDIKLPGMNGFEVIQTLHNNHTEMDVPPVVLLSGIGDKMSVRAGMKVGAKDYLTKPIDPDILFLTVEKHLRPLTKEVAPSTSQPAPRDGAHTNPNSREPESLPQFRAKAAVAIENKGSAIGAVLQLLTPEEIKETFGDDWPRLREKCMLIAEGVIRQSLSPKDYFSRGGEVTFNLLLADIDERRAQVRVEVMAMNIRQRLLGDGGEAGSTVKVVGDVLDIKEFSEPDGATALDELRDPSQTEAKDSKQRSSNNEGGHVLAAPTNNWLRDQIHLTYRPIWDAANHMVSAYQAYPVRKSSYATYEGATVLHGGDMDPMAIDLDLQVLNDVFEMIAAEKTAKEDIPTMISVPIHYTSLCGDVREHLGDVLLEAPSDSLKRLIFEICGLPDIRGEYSITRSITFLTFFSPQVIVSAPPDDRHAKLFRQSGASALKIDLEDVRGQPSLPELTKFIKKFGKDAEKLNLRSRIDGISTIDQFRSAVAGGVDFACGPTIGWTVESPRQTYRLEDTQILGL